MLGTGSFLLRSHNRAFRIQERDHFKMFNFVLVQGIRRFHLQAYIEYFEEKNLSRTQKLGKRERFS